MGNNYIYHYTEAEFEDIQAKFDGKAEYDNGMIYLSSDTGVYHNEIISNINTYLTLYFKGSKCKSYTEQIEVIFQSDNDLKKYKPDIFIMCNDAIRKGESFISVPKVIFEVVSKSTSSHDYITKLAAYQRYGVPEYNIVEQNGNIIQYSFEDGRYHILNTYKNNDDYVSCVFPDLKINLKDIF